MLSDWTSLAAMVAVAVSVLTLVSRAMDKSLSIREHEAYKAAVDRDIHRVEARLQLLEQTRPTTGELEILAESLNKRIDLIQDRSPRR